MKNNIISLPEVTLGAEYNIDHIKNSSLDKIDFRGYGIVPGTNIKLLFKSPTKDPYAYEIMGTVLALRNIDAANIYVSPKSIY